MKLWIESEHHKDDIGVILSFIDRTSSMCQSSRQNAMLLDVITDLVMPEFFSVVGRVVKTVDSHLGSPGSFLLGCW